MLVLRKGFQDSVSMGVSPSMDLYYDKSKELEVGLLQRALSANLFSSIGQS